MRHLERAVIVVPLALTLAGAARAQTVPERATITGIVYDSIAQRPLAGALVNLASVGGAGGRTFGATSDSTGAFRIDSVPFGAYAAGFYQSALDSLGLEGRPIGVAITQPSQRIDLATPSSGTIVRGFCGDQNPADSTGLLLGHVFDASTGGAVSGATVAVGWTETTLSPSRLLETVPRTATVKSRESGWFALCGVPAGFPVAVSAMHAADTTGDVNVQLEPGSLQHVTFYLGSARRVSDSTGVSHLVGSARIVGHVRDAHGKPITAAHAGIIDAGGAAAVNDHGVFTLDSLPSGTRRLDVYAIGYLPAHQIVQLTDATATSVDVTMQRVVSVAGMRTQALVYSKNEQRFDAHVHTSVGGHFVTAAEIARFPGRDLRQLLLGFNGVDIRSDPANGWVISMGINPHPTEGNRGCVPFIFIDGQRSFLPFDNVNAYLTPDQILGVEVYTRHAEVPTDLPYDFANECGAVAVWTRPPPLQAPKQP